MDLCQYVATNYTALLPLGLIGITLYQKLFVDGTSFGESLKSAKEKATTLVRKLTGEEKAKSPAKIKAPKDPGFISSVKPPAAKED